MTEQKIQTLKILLRNRGFKLGPRTIRGTLYLTLDASRWKGNPEKALKIGEKLIREYFPDAEQTSGSHTDRKYVFKTNESGTEGSSLNTD